ncbi:MAG: Sensor protein, partial [uncultured bacterium]
PPPLQAVAKPLAGRVGEEILGQAGLLTLIRADLAVSNGCASRNTFVKSLIEEKGESSIADFFDPTSSIGRQTHQLSQEADRQIKILSALFIVSLILAITFFFYFRHTLIARLTRLNRTVLAMVEGENREIEESGCDEISAIAGSINFLSSELHKAKATAEKSAITKSEFLAEDNEINQQITIGFLDSAGLSTTVVQNGAEAVEILEQEQAAAFFEKARVPEGLPEESAANAHGIDMKAGLSRTMGNPSLYFKLLATFVEKYRSYPALMREEFKKLSFDGVRQMVHTLKGVSSNLAMRTLSAKCVQLESSIKRKKMSECNTLLLDIQHETENICDFLRQYLDRYKNTVSNIPTIKKQEYSDSENKNTLLADLADSLTHNSSKAIRQISRLQSHLEQEDRIVFARIAKQIDDLDFEKARTLLIQWQNSFRK